jgi:hypothetical protein
LARRTVRLTLGRDADEGKGPRPWRAGATTIQLESRTGEVAQTIIDIAQEKQADAIVVGRRGAGLVAGLLLGSVSQKLVSLAPLPVIVIPNQLRERIMIEMLEGFPDGVVAAVAKGRVTKRDYDEALIPAVEAAFRRREKVRCYYELGREFSGMDAGAAWEDFRIGIGHLSGWERIAVVTDVDWVRLAINAFRFLVPGEIRIFPTSEVAEARRWIVADLTRDSPPD